MGGDGLGEAEPGVGLKRWVAVRDVCIMLCVLLSWNAVTAATRNYARDCCSLTVVATVPSLCVGCSARPMTVRLLLPRLNPRQVDWHAQHGDPPGELWRV